MREMMMMAREESVYSPLWMAAWGTEGVCSALSSDGVGLIVCACVCVLRLRDLLDSDAGGGQQQRAVNSQQSAARSGNISNSSSSSSESRSKPGPGLVWPGGCLVCVACESASLRLCDGELSRCRSWRSS